MAVYSLLVGPEVPEEGGVDEPGVPPPDDARRLAAHAALVEGERAGGRARGLLGLGGTDGATWGPNWVLAPPALAVLYRFACRCMYVINSCISRTMFVVAD